MNNNFKIWRLIPITIIGLYIIYKLVKDLDSTFILDGVFMFGLAFVFICIFIYNIFLDRKAYRETNSKMNFLPTILGILIISSFGITQLILNKRDSSKLILQANNDGGYNGCGFEFREDGSYKFFNGSGLGVDYFRGNYTLIDSIITLDKSEIDNVIKSNRLIIREFTTNKSKIIYQIDNNNQIIDKALDFNVNEDNRTK